MEEDQVTIPQFQSYRHASVGGWCQHEAVKSLVSVPVASGKDVSFMGARDRHRPGNNGRAVVQRINQVLMLRSGWDGAHAQPVAEAAVHGVVAVLNEIALEGAPVPDVSPSIDGGLLLEWRRNGFELEVWIAPDGSASVTYDRDGASWEADWQGCSSGVREILIHMTEFKPELAG